VVKRMPTLNQDEAVWEEGDEDEEQNGDSGRRPQPLRGLKDFFYSASPLDDFFVTFESTKGMVDPISWRGGRRREQQCPQVTGMPDNVKFNLSQRLVRTGSDSQCEGPTDLEKGGFVAD
jgi:hypothetical protein